MPKTFGRLQLNRRGDAVRLGGVPKTQSAFILLADGDNGST
jgi:hypothetical protein